MIPHAKTETKTQIRQTILDMAGLILREEGPQALSMRKLAERVGASTIVLYTYFKNKQDIFDGLYREGFRRLKQDLESTPQDLPPIEYVMALGRSYHRSAIQNPTYYQIMFSHTVPGFIPSGESLSFSLESLRILESGVQRCLDAGLVKGVSAGAIAQVLWSTLHGVISLELFGYVSSKEMAQDRLELALRTIRDGLIK